MIIAPALTIIVLGSTQTLAWASSYYLPAVLADDMSRDLGLSTNWIFGIFSASLDPHGGDGAEGRPHDRRLGRQRRPGRLPICCSLPALFLLQLSHSLPMFAAAWVVMAIGMGLGLYDSAFATLGRSMAPTRAARSPASP